jgi:hypothetical protein
MGGKRTTDKTHHGLLFDDCPKITTPFCTVLKYVHYKCCGVAL